MACRHWEYNGKTGVATSYRCSQLHIFIFVFYCLVRLVFRFTVVYVLGHTVLTPNCVLKQDINLCLKKKQVESVQYSLLTCHHHIVCCYLLVHKESVTSERWLIKQYIDYEAITSPRAGEGKWYTVAPVHWIWILHDSIRWRKLERKA